MTNLTFTPTERAILDKALRLYRDRHYRDERTTTPETYAKNRAEFDRAETLRDKVNQNA